LDDISAMMMTISDDMMRTSALWSILMLNLWSNWNFRI
jgi:hypothetical protein